MTRTASELLREASKLIDTALITLDTSQYRCGGCHGRIFTNHKHAKVYDRLTNVPHRLNTCADSLEDPKPKSRRH